MLVVCPFSLFEAISIICLNSVVGTRSHAVDLGRVARIAATKAGLFLS